MNDLKTQLNLLIPIGRLFLSLFGGLNIFLFLPSFICDFKINEFSKYIPFVLVLFVLGIIIFIFIKPFVKTTKSYTIKSDSIEEFNFLTFKKKSIDKENIKGFSTSLLQYGIWKFDEIIIYLKDGSKINIAEFTYFNFSKIKPTLIDKNYKYFGFELLEDGWFYRNYKYDD